MAFENLQIVGEAMVSELEELAVRLRRFAQAREWEQSPYEAQQGQERRLVDRT